MLIIKFKHHHYTKIKLMTCDCVAHIDCKLMFVNSVIFICDRVLMSVFRKNECKTFNLKTFIFKNKWINLQEFFNKMTFKLCFVFRLQILRSVNEII